MLTSLVLLVTMATSTFAMGSLTFVSKCRFPVWYQVVPKGGGNPPWVSFGSTPIIIPYARYPIDDGIALKFSLTDLVPGDDADNIAQVEWSTGNGPQISFDLSNLNGTPFEATGMELTPSVGPSEQYQTCINSHCAAGDTACQQAYITGGSNNRTLVCGWDTSLLFTACSG